MPVENAAASIDEVHYERVNEGPRLDSTRPLFAGALRCGKQPRAVCQAIRHSSPYVAAQAPVYAPRAAYVPKIAI